MLEHNLNYDEFGWNNYFIIISQNIQKINLKHYNDN